MPGITKTLQHTKRLDLRTQRHSEFCDDNFHILWTAHHNILFSGATAQGGPSPPLQYASKPLDPLLCLSIHLFPSFLGPWTRHPAISFSVFLFVLLHTAFRTTSFFGIAVSCICIIIYLLNKDQQDALSFLNLFQ